MSLRKHFAAYLPLQREDISELWASAVVVFDANVLLQLYRYGATTRNQVISLLEKRLNGRVWLSYHAALEFFRHREGEIEKDTTRISRLNDELRKWKTSLKSLLDDARLEEIGALIDVDKLEKQIEAVLQERVTSTVETVAKTYPNLKAHDPIVIFLTNIVSDSIGEKPTQAAVDSWDKLAESRFARSIPPGYKDAKVKSGEYIDGDVIYKLANGDLYLWMQMLDAIRSDPKRFQSVIFVTNDQKDDWWIRSDGKTTGPRVELRQEVTKAGCVRFHMYTFSSFIKHLGSEQGSTAPPLTTDAIKEIEKVQLVDESFSEAAFREDLLSLEKSLREQSGLGKNRSRYPEAVAESAVAEWLIARYGDSSVKRSRGSFPDFIVRSGLLGTARLAVEVAYVRDQKQITAAVVRNYMRFLELSSLEEDHDNTHFEIIFVLPTKDDALLAPLELRAVTDKWLQVNFRFGYLDGSTFVDVASSERSR